VDEADLAGLACQLVDLADQAEVVGRDVKAAPAGFTRISTS
jgi:hypothetical protein